MLSALGGTIDASLRYRPVPIPSDCHLAFMIVSGTGKYVNATGSGPVAFASLGSGPPFHQLETRHIRDDDRTVVIGVREAVGRGM